MIEPTSAQELAAAAKLEQHRVGSVGGTDDAGWILTPNAPASPAAAGRRLAHSSRLVSALFAPSAAQHADREYPVAPCSRPGERDQSLTADVAEGADNKPPNR